MAEMHSQHLPICTCILVNWGTVGVVSSFFSTLVKICVRATAPPEGLAYESHHFEPHLCWHVDGTFWSTDEEKDCFKRAAIFINTKSFYQTAQVNLLVTHYPTLSSSASRILNCISPFHKPVEVNSDERNTVFKTLNFPLISSSPAVNVETVSEMALREQEQEIKDFLVLLTAGVPTGRL